jgi:hypothetical protein
VSLQDASDLAQVVGVLAVMASLVFVGMEVRQNSAITRAQVHQQLSDTFTSYLETLASHAGIVAAGTDSKAGLSRMTDDELLQFSFLMAGLFKIWENAFYQYKSGFLDERAWRSNVTWMLAWFHLPGVQTWWSVRKDLFSLEFQALVESSPPPTETQSISTRLRDAAGALVAGP